MNLTGQTPPPIALVRSSAHDIVHPDSADRDCTPATLTDAEQAMLDRGFRVSLDAARRKARTVVPAHVVDDAVSNAVVKMIGVVIKRRDTGEPVEIDPFLPTFVAIVKTVAIDYQRRRTGATRRPQPDIRPDDVPSRKVPPTRTELISFKDVALHEMPAVHTGWPDVSRTAELAVINGVLSMATDGLTDKQRAVIENTFDRSLKRATVARLLGISIKTYDVHLQCALERMRPRVLACLPMLSRDVPGNWDAVIIHLCQRMQARRHRKAA